MATAHLRYRYEPEGWWAESPEHPGYSAFGGSLEEVRLLAHEGLRFFADDAGLEIFDPISELLAAASITVGVEPEETAMPEYPTGASLGRYIQLDESGDILTPAAA